MNLLSPFGLDLGGGSLQGGPAYSGANIYPGTFSPNLGGITTGGGGSNMWVWIGLAALAAYVIAKR